MGYIEKLIYGPFVNQALLWSDWVDNWKLPTVFCQSPELSVTISQAPILDDRQTGRKTYAQSVLSSEIKCRVFR
jgi:hypothetical protein